MNEQTRQAVKQWKVKAQSDWKTIQILKADCNCPADTVCFHCRQFVEKLLKALLTAHEIETPRTHDLRRLIQLAQPFAPQLSKLADAADALTVHGVESRYPDDFRQIDDKEMNEAIDLAGTLGEMLLEKLKI